MEHGIEQMILLDLSKERSVDSQASHREGQTTDLALELLTPVSVLIHESSQGKVLLLNCSTCISQQIVREGKKKKEK